MDNVDNRLSLMNSFIPNPQVDIPSAFPAYPHFSRPYYYVCYFLYKESIIIKTKAVRISL